MRLLVFLFLLIPALTLGQCASFRIVEKQTRLSGLIRYPLVKYHDKKTEKKINDEVALQLLGSVVKDGSDLDEKLEAEGDILYQLYHTVTYNKDYVLSFNIFMEGCGAYCSSMISYFNFDLTTGKPILWPDLVTANKADTFETIVKDRMRREMTEFAETGLDSVVVSDSTAQDWIRESFDFCLNSLGIYGFAIYPGRIDFVNQCDFPNAIKAYTPENIFPYHFKELAPYLKPRYLALFLKK